jgi:hypothetical protein
MVHQLQGKLLQRERARPAAATGTAVTAAATTAASE